LGLGTTTVELSYVAPDRYDIKTIIGDTVEETIKIGDNTYYQTTIQGVIPQVGNPYSSPMDPDVGSTFSLLNALHDFQTLPDQRLTELIVYHYEGILFGLKTRYSSRYGSAKMIIYPERDYGQRLYRGVFQF